MTFGHAAKVYLRSCSVLPCLAGVMVCAGLIVVIGVRSTAIPVFHGEAPPAIPGWRILVTGIAVLPVMGLQSDLAALEEGQTVRLRRMQLLLLGVASLVAWAACVVAVGVAVSGSAALVALRSLPAWLGLGLISGRLLGWSLSWVLPIVVMVAMIAVGDLGGLSSWWRFNSVPQHKSATVVLTLGLLFGGGLAYSATPWRVHVLRRRLWRRSFPTPTAGAATRSSERPESPH